MRVTSQALACGHLDDLVTYVTHLSGSADDAVEFVAGGLAHAAKYPPTRLRVDGRAALYRAVTRACRQGHRFPPRGHGPSRFLRRPRPAFQARIDGDAASRMNTVKRALATLPFERRAALLLHDLAGLDYREMSRALECSPEAAGRLLAGGTARLRHHLQRDRPVKCSLLTLSTFIDGELAPQRRAEVDAHLVGCARCSAGAATLREEKSRVGQLARVHASTRLGAADARAGGHRRRPRRRRTPPPPPPPPPPPDDDRRPWQRGDQQRRAAVDAAPPRRRVPAGRATSRRRAVVPDVQPDLPLEGVRAAPPSWDRPAAPPPGAGRRSTAHARPPMTAAAAEPRLGRCRRGVAEAATATRSRGRRTCRRPRTRRRARVTVVERLDAAAAVERVRAARCRRRPAPAAAGAPPTRAGHAPRDRRRCGPRSTTRSACAWPSPAAATRSRTPSRSSAGRPRAVARRLASAAGRRAAVTAPLRRRSTRRVLAARRWT